MKREEEIKQILEEANIFDAKLVPQIALVARLEDYVASINKELKKSTLLITETRGKEQDEHLIVNPLLPYLLTTEKQLQTAYASIGLNYNLNPQNISSTDDGKDGLEEIMNL